MPLDYKSIFGVLFLSDQAYLIDLPPTISNCPKKIKTIFCCNVCLALCLSVLDLTNVLKG